MNKEFCKSKIRKGKLGVAKKSRILYPFECFFFIKRICSKTLLSHCDSCNQNLFKDCRKPFLNFSTFPSNPSQCLSNLPNL